MKPKSRNSKKARVGSQKDLADERGLAKATVTIAIKNGTLDPAIIGKDAKGRRILDLDHANTILDGLVATKKRESSPPLPVETAIEKDEDIPEDQIPPQVISRAKREFYQAKLARLEFHEKAGRLVDADTVKKEAFELARTVRDSILAIPDRLAAILAAEKAERRVHDLLTKELTQALSDLQRRAT